MSGPPFPRWGPGARRSQISCLPLSYLGAELDFSLGLKPTVTFLSEVWWKADLILSFVKWWGQKEEKICCACVNGELRRWDLKALFYQVSWKLGNFIPVRDEGSEHFWTLSELIFLCTYAYPLMDFDAHRVGGRWAGFWGQYGAEEWHGVQGCSCSGLSWASPKVLGICLTIAFYSQGSKFVPCGQYCLLFSKNTRTFNYPIFWVHFLS